MFGAKDVFSSCEEKYIVNIRESMFYGIILYLEQDQILICCYKVPNAACCQDALLVVDLSNTDCSESITTSS